MRAVKLPWLQKNGMKRVGGMVAKGVKKIGKFTIKQLHHPAVGNFTAFILFSVSW